MDFIHQLEVLGILAASPTGRTLGEIKKRLAMGSYSKHRIEKALDRMREGGLVRRELFNYRPNVVSSRYFINEKAVWLMADVLATYEENEKQLVLGIK